MLAFKYLSLWISEHLNRAPAATLVIATALTILCSLGLTQLGISYGHYSYFDSGDSTIVDYDTTQKTFTSSDNILFVISANSKAALKTPESIHAIEWLTNKSWDLPFTERVQSLSNTQVLSHVNGKVVVDDLITDSIDYPADTLNRLIDALSTSPSLKGKLLSGDGRSAVVSVTLSKNESKNITYPQANAAAMELAAQFDRHFPSLRLEMGGYVPLFNAAVDTTIEDLRLLTPILLLLIIALLYAVFRHPPAVFGVILAVVFSMAATMGIVGWTGLSLNGTTAATPILILTVSIASSLHLVSSYLRKLHLCHSKSKALARALEINFRPILITAATTITGFLSFNLSDVPPFRQLGNIAALGVALSVIYSITVLPAYLILAGPNRCKKPKQFPAIYTLAKLVTSHPRNTVLICLLCATGMSSFIVDNRYNDQFESYFDASSPFRQSMDAINSAMGGTDTIEIVVSHRDGMLIVQPSVMSQIEDLSEWLRQLPSVLHVSSISETVKRLNQEHTGSYFNAYKVPATALETRELISEYQANVKPQYSLNDQIAPSLDQTRLTLVTKPMDAVQSIQLDEKISKHINLNYPDLASKNTSISLSFSYIGANSSSNMILAAGVGLLSISVLLMLMFRSFKLGVISVIPNLLPGIVAFGVWGLLVGELSVGVSAALGIAMGVIVDDTIHFLSHYCSMLDKGASPHRAVFSTLVRIGPVLIVTTAVLAAGFLILSQTVFRLNSDLGYFCALTLVLALLFDLTLLPSTLILVKNYQTRKLEKLREEKIQHSLDGVNEDELILIENDSTFDLHSQNIKIYLQEIHTQNHPENRCNVAVLSRIEDKQGKLLFPRSFLPQLDSLGLLSEYDRITILKLFDKLDDDITRFTRVELFNINVSLASLMDPSFAHFVSVAAKSRHIQPERLCFEFNCSAWSTAPAETKRFIEAMRAARFKLALCINNESEMPGLKSPGLEIDFLKVDARFVERSQSDSTAAKTFAQIKQHAHRHDAVIIARNVDRKNLKALVNASGIKIFQGYEIATPVDINWASFVELPFKQTQLNPI